MNGSASSTSRLTTRDDSKPLPTVNAIRLEIIMIDGEHRIEMFSTRQMDQRGVGKVHGPVGVAVHQRLEIGEVNVFDGENRDGARAKESPSGNQFTSIIAQQMEQFRQDGGGGGQRQAKSGERLGAPQMPA